MELVTPVCRLRPWTTADKAALVEAGNNRKVWRNLTHLFPHPYTGADADQWFEFVAAAAPDTHLAIEADGRAIGAISAVVGLGIFARSAEFGYWLGEPWWGRGIATAASIAYTRWFMRTHQLHRMQAYVFAWNKPSMRVLEKTGFVREAVLARGAVKDGQVVDEMLYALTDQRLHMLRAPLRVVADGQREREWLEAGSALA